tara:strand:+ start:2857 stop:3177 length:321 start_codon:yes stop_codon:yes gene_type:complete
MIHNQNDYKIINIPTYKKNISLGIFLKTNYTKSSYFDYFFPPSQIIKYPIVCKIDHASIAYKHGLRAGDTVIQLNNISFLDKDIKTIQSYFSDEKEKSNYIKLTIR